MNIRHIQTSYCNPVKLTHLCPWICVNLIRSSISDWKTTVIGPTAPRENAANSRHHGSLIESTLRTSQHYGVKGLKGTLIMPGDASLSDIK